MRVLCLDIEGGNGGSSRSLLTAVGQLDRDSVFPTVWCRRGGWIEEAYAELGVPCQIEADMPRWTCLERASRNVIDRARFLLKTWPRSKSFRDTLLAVSWEYDVLHLNHVSLTDLALWIRAKRPEVRIVMHIRTMPYASRFAVRQTKDAAKACDAFVFISENERDHFEALLGEPVPGEVIFNPVHIPGGPAPLTRRSGPLNAVCLANYSYLRGIDRVLEIAEAIPKNQRSKVRFTIAGNMKLPSKFPRDREFDTLGKHDLAEVADSRGLAERITFLGHVTDPESVLANADVLLKPTRENNPWGRDILESLAFGRPAISVGSDSTFIETNKTGLLQSRFNAAGVADFLLALATDTETLNRLGEAARDRVKKLANPKETVTKLVAVWNQTKVGEQHSSMVRTRFAAVLPSYASGGAERVLLALISGLPREQFASRLLVVDESGDLNVDLSRIGFVHNLNSRRLRDGLWKIFSFLKNFNTQVVFSSQAHLNIGILLLARFLPLARVVVREANMPSACLKTGHWPRWYQPVYRFALKRASIAIASSEMMAREIRDVLGVPKARIRVLYNPVDEAGLRQRGGKPRGRSGAGRQFIAVGRLVKQKGFDRLIEWMAEMPEVDRLEILGDGEERDKLMAQIEARSLTERVFLRGHISDPASLIAGADALLMSSRWEGMPNAALEALALGTPVIATDECGAISEVSHRAIFGAVTVVPPDDTFLLAMRSVTPKSGLCPSLLPVHFRIDSIQKAFSRLMCEVAGQK